MASSVEREGVREEVVSVELPAPDGWKKKFFPKQGGTPKKMRSYLHLQQERRLLAKDNWNST